MFNPDFGWVRVARPYVFGVMPCKELYRLVIILSVLQFTVNVYPFGIFKLFLSRRFYLRYNNTVINSP